MWSRAIPTYFEQSNFHVLFGLGIGKHALLAQRVYDPFSDLSEDSDIQYTIDITTVFCFCSSSLVRFPSSYSVIFFWKSFKVGFGWFKMERLDWERKFGSVIIALVVGYTLNDSISNGFVDRTSLNMLYWPILAAGYTLKEILIEENETLIVEPIQIGTDADTTLAAPSQTNS